MAAYYVALARHVPEDWREVIRPYMDQVEATMAHYGGFYRTYLPTIVEFPSWEQLLAWYHSEEYAPLKALRQQHMRFDVMLIDGLTDAEIAENRRLVGLGEPGVP